MELGEDINLNKAIQIFSTGNWELGLGNGQLVSKRGWTCKCKLNNCWMTRFLHMSWGCREILYIETGGSECRESGLISLAIISERGTISHLGYCNSLLSHHPILHSAPSWQSPHTSHSDIPQIKSTHVTPSTGFPLAPKMPPTLFLLIVPAPYQPTAPASLLLDMATANSQIPLFKWNVPLHLPMVASFLLYGSSI